MNAPTYKVNKNLLKILKRHLKFKYQYSVKKLKILATDLTKLKLNKTHQLITYDIKDQYFNIPIDETITITNSMLIKTTTPK